jgi:phytoene dehydrogenase-like protein
VRARAPGALDDGEVVAAWNDPARTAAEIERFSPADARSYLATDAELKALAARLQPLFLDLPRTPGPPVCAAAASCCAWAGGCAGCAGASLRA